jgi:hypothetical protein
MPKAKPTPAAELSDQLLLAALERAERHQRREGQGVLLATLKDHLGLPHHSGTTVRMRPQLDRLQDTGLIQYGRHGGLKLWKLTDRGRGRLKRARRFGETVALPESPQHRKWATARRMAEEQITQLRADLRRTLDQATTMLDTETTTSDAWFEMIPRLNDACRRVAIATYTLCEWVEPDDSRPDIDPHPQRDRRNIHAWTD